MGGHLQAPAADFGEAFAAARAAADVDAMAEAAIGLASQARFGVHAGRAPAVLFEAYEAAAGKPATRIRLAATLARAWVYGNDQERAKPFADEAVDLAERLADPALLADALDARLGAGWGPDDMVERLHLSARLQDVAAHLDDPAARLQSHLWRLTTALENLDVVGVQRQLAALDVLADETDLPVVRFFAASRRAMYSLLVGDLDRAEAQLDNARTAGAAAEAPDLYAIERSISADLARQRADVDGLLREADIYESYGANEGIPSITAEAAVLWMDAGDTDRAARLVAQFGGPTLRAIPRDVDWLLTLTKVVEAAARTGAADVAAEGFELLRPYAGRAVLNAGAVTFQGVVEDYLHLAAVASGTSGHDDLLAAAGGAYRRLGATWWLRRLEVRTVSTAARGRTTAGVLHLHQLPGQSAWAVGRDGDVRVVPESKGLHYLRMLVARPGVDIAAADLVAAVAGHSAVPASDVGELLDRRALAAYRQRLRDIDEERTEATAWSDEGRVARLDAEREALLGEVGRATGLHGRPRRAGSQDERARVAVRKAIAAALDRLDEHEPVASRLLRRCVRTGAFCRFEPDPDRPVTWQLTQPE